MSCEGTLNEDIIEIVLYGIQLGSHFHFSEVNLPPEDRSDPTKTTTELRSLLRSVGHKLQSGAKGFVVVRKPSDNILEKLDRLGE